LQHVQFARVLKFGQRFGAFGLIEKTEAAFGLKAASVFLLVRSLSEKRGLARMPYLALP
jgi:hypothetical protein